MLTFVYLILNGLSRYLSSSGMSQGLQMSRAFFPSMSTHLYMCLSSICVLAHTSIYLPGGATEQSCKSKLRTEIFCVSGKINLGLKLRRPGIKRFTKKTTSIKYSASLASTHLNLISIPCVMCFPHAWYEGFSTHPTAHPPAKFLLSNLQTRTGSQGTLWCSLEHGPSYG